MRDARCAMGDGEERIHPPDDGVHVGRRGAVATSLRSLNAARERTCVEVFRAALRCSDPVDARANELFSRDSWLDARGEVTLTLTFD